MGDAERFLTAEEDPAAPPGPLPLPEGAQPVEGVTGYHALIKGSAVTVFGPDGAEIASAARRGYNDALVGRVGDTRLVSDGFGDRRLTSFAVLAARHHRAAADPGVRDRVWVRWEEDGVAAVYGTIKGDDADRRAVKAGNLYWSGQRQGWATGRKWNPGTRDRNLAAVLLAFSRQDRNVVVLGPGQTPEDLVASPTAPTLAAAAIPAQQDPSAAAPPVTAPEPEPEPVDFSGLSYEDLVAAEDAADMERSRRYSTDTTAAEARYQRLCQERGRRLLDRVATATAVTELSNEDLAAESEWWQKTIYKTPFHSSDESYRTLERRRTEVTVEQNGRTARTLLAGPAVADLDDAELESAYEQIGPVWTRLPGGHELNEQVTDYRKSLQEERVARRARSYGERTPVGEMTLEDLVAESADLGSQLAARNEQSAYSYSEAVKEARAERLRAVEAEWERRGLEQHPDAARATLGSNLGGRRQVLIDGSERAYGYVERQGKKFRALTSYDQRSSIGDFDSGPAAMAALVQRYDQDPETLPRRTWGRERAVILPSSSHDPLVSWLRRRPGEASREFARVLEILTPYELPTQTKVLNPLTNQVMRAYPFGFEEGLLGELVRIAERTTEDLREQSLNEELPRREREAAKRRIPAMGAALIGINAVIEQVRAAGGDVERRGVDQGRLAAQMAALAGTVDEREGGGADGEDRPVRDAAAQALGGVPAAGVGGDGGPGGVLPDAGDADGRGDRRGGGGAGGGAGAGDGLPGAGRADGADRGDGAGAGAARDAAAAGGRGRPGGADESGSGGAGGDPQGAGEPVAAGRFRPDPADLPRGPLARAEANIEAVKVLRTLEGDRRGATNEEKRVLARWSGWGSVPTVFLDEPDPDEPIYRPGGEREGRFETDHARWESYSRVRGELRDLLDPFEWRAASRAVLSAHYTPQGVAEAMWQGLAAYGFDGGEVLEAGCGSGAFFGVAPQAARLTGIELDPTTAAIAARIYPHANVLPESFTDTDAPAGTFDAVIGNVPFAQAPFGERRYRAGGHSLHNGFIIKQLALLRPGGYMAVITSRWTLDGEDTAARRDMARWGDLAAAYRLPKGTFGETADTDVVADVLVFRRRAEGEEPGDQGWIEAPERELNGNTLTVNAYFTEHPEHVLGRLTSETGPYGPRVTVQGDPGEAPRLLRERMEATAAAAIAAGLGYTPHEDWPHREPVLLQTARVKHAKDFTGRLYTDGQGRIWQHVNGADPVRVITADGVSGTEQLRMLLSLRDTASELQELDRTGSDPDRAREIRGQLSRLHTAYTAAYRPLSRPRQTRMALPSDEAAAAARDAGIVLDGEERLPTGWGWFRQDPHAAVVLGLEHWDRANDRPVPSEVLTRRPGTRRGDLETTDDPKTALTAVMGATGRVDLPLIASLLGTTPEETRHRLGTEVFDNPVTKKLEPAGAYLSGPVRQKLDEAHEAAATDPAYAVNVAALEAVQPPPKRLGQFTAQLGAHWIPAGLVQGFLREYLGDPTLQISHNERYGWSLAAGKVPDAINALKGTERRSAVHIAKALLGRASMVVNQLDGIGVDEDATRAMRYKADAMRSAFEDYCTASTARVTLLTDAYNRQMNGHVVRSYDSLAPTLAGFTTERTPHPWQLSAAARMQFERGVVLAHEVGLGKTTTMVMGSQALKASGQIGKPFAVVQPHLARQWLDEASLIYPNADIHLITSDDLADGNRRPVLEWLRSNTPDLVILTEGAFGSIRMSPEQQELYLFREIESLKEQLERERGVPHNAFALMKLEQRLATVEARIRRNDAPMRTPGEVYWDDLGFDYALIDEAHRFTAVGFRSKEAGGETASVRAVDLHQKLSWHHRMAEYDGGRPTVTLGTGTPMENSIFEQYSVLELATPWLLDEFGVHGPDLWSETFGQKVQRIEMAPDGSGLTIVERFSRFVSKSTMKTMWGLAADTKTGDDVGIERPKLAGGTPELMLVEPTADQRSRLQSLVARGQAIHAGDVTRDEDNMLAVSGEGRAVALDPRLVDAGAPAANKLMTAADIIAAGYHAHKDHTYAVSSHDDTPHLVPGGLFFVFCNSGTPGGNNKGNFDAYAELRDLLAARGVPRDLVQFAQDNTIPEKKAAMSQAANNGGIAVLMGSTEVLGTGFNGQNRAYALMHLDQDWTPASMIQRNGRVIRPGNQHEEVNIYFLATKGSMDAWQVGLLTSKAEGLRDIQRPPGEGNDDNDTVEEIGASDWDYATMAAEIGGNPYMRQFMEAKLQLQGLEADRRNAAADRVRQAELLLRKETELSSTQRAIAARDAALPKVTTTIRGDAFHIKVGGRDFDQRGEAGPVLRQAVADALRGHSTLGMGAWAKLGTFGGLDFAVRPEILDSGAEIRAHVGFPDLRHSESVCSIGDLANPRFGATVIGRLATALEKAEDHQLTDRERLPVLEAEISLLAAQQAAVDYGPAIEHARRRVELLDAVVGAITERDKLPELTESMLDPKKYPTPDSRRKAVQERAEQRAPHQAKVDQAAAALTAYDQTAPAPELPTAPAPVPEATAAGPGDGSGDRAATKEPTPQATEVGDGYGTADLYETFGLTKPERVPAPVPQDEPDPEAETEAEAEESAGVPDGQLTVKEAQPEAATAGQNASGGSAAAKDDGRERLTSTDGRLTFTLLAVPADAGFHQEAVEGYQRRRSELAAVVEAKNEQAAQTPAEQADHLNRWRQTYKTANGLEPFRPLPSLRLTRREDAPGLIPAEYDIGSWVTWRDGPNSQQVTGQVMSPGPGKDTWYVSTDRTGVTGEYHVLSRSGKKATGYTYALNGAAADLRPADGPVEQVPFEDLPPVDSVPAEPLTSYTDYVPRTGLAVVREPIPVTVGEIAPRGPELVFDVLADRVPFVVTVNRHDSSAIQLFTPRIEIDGEEVLTFSSAESRGGAAEICERVVREARENAAKPLRAHHRDYDFALAADGRCGRYNLHADDAEPQPLYRVGDGDPLCIEHVVSTFDVERSEVGKLARARQVWGIRVAAEPAAAVIPGTPPADVEQHTEQQPEGPAAQETAAAAASQDPHEVAREALQGGDRITVVVNGRSIEWDGEAWGLPVPETATVTGTVHPGHRDYRQNTTLLDAVIRHQTGKEVTATDSVFIRQLPAQAHLIPAQHRDDLRPETRTVAQIRLGDLIAEGGTRGESVTELRFADNNRRGSVMAFSTRDVAKGTTNGFALNLTDEVLIVPRERRAPQDVVAVFGRHGSHDQVASETQRTYDLHVAVAEVTSRVWPDATGPQDEIQALSRAIGAIDATARGVDAYRANAAAMTTAAAAAAALFDAADGTARYNGYIGESLHQLRQHLDLQVNRLHADIAHLTRRKQEPAAAAAADTPATGGQPENPADPVVAAEEASDSPEETRTEFTADTPPAEPAEPAAPDAYQTDSQPETAPAAADTATDTGTHSPAEQLDLFGSAPATPQDQPPGGDAAAGQTAEESQQPPTLDVAPPELEVPPLGPAEPYTADVQAAADIEQSPAQENAGEEAAEPSDGSTLPDDPVAKAAPAATAETDQAPANESASERTPESSDGSMPQDDPATETAPAAPVETEQIGLFGDPDTGSPQDEPERRPLPDGMRWVHRHDVRPGDVVRFGRDGVLRDAVLILSTNGAGHLSYDHTDGGGMRGSWDSRDEYVVVVDRGPDRTAFNRYIKRYGDYMRNDLAEALARSEERRQRNDAAQGSPDTVQEPEPAEAALDEEPATPADGVSGEQPEAAASTDAPTEGETEPQDQEAGPPVEQMPLDLDTPAPQTSIETGPADPLTGTSAITAEEGSDEPAEPPTATSVPEAQLPPAPDDLQSTAADESEQRTEQTPHELAQSQTEGVADASPTSEEAAPVGTEPQSPTLDLTPATSPNPEPAGDLGFGEPVIASDGTRGLVSGFRDGQYLVMRGDDDEAAYPRSALSRETEPVPNGAAEPPVSEGGGPVSVPDQLASTVDAAEDTADPSEPAPAQPEPGRTVLPTEGPATDITGSEKLMATPVPAADQADGQQPSRPPTAPTQPLPTATTPSEVLTVGDTRYARFTREDGVTQIQAARREQPRPVEILPPTPGPLARLAWQVLTGPQAPTVLQQQQQVEAALGDLHREYKRLHVQATALGSFSQLTAGEEATLDGIQVRLRTPSLLAEARLTDAETALQRAEDDLAAGSILREQYEAHVQRVRPFREGLRMIQTIIDPSKGPESASPKPVAPPERDAPSWNPIHPPLRIRWFDEVKAALPREPRPGTNLSRGDMISLLYHENTRAVRRQTSREDAGRRANEAVELYLQGRGDEVPQHLAGEGLVYVRAADNRGWEIRESGPATRPDAAQTDSESLHREPLPTAQDDALSQPLADAQAAFSEVLADTRDGAERFEAVQQGTADLRAELDELRGGLTAQEIEEAAPQEPAPAGLDDVLAQHLDAVGAALPAVREAPPSSEATEASDNEVSDNEEDVPAGWDRVRDAVEELRGRVPERLWQPIQRVLTRVEQLWQTAREAAGERWAHFRADARWQGLWRAVVSTSCQTVADYARRESTAQPGLPGAEARSRLLERLAERAEAVADRQSHPHFPGATYRTGRESVQAARDIARALKDWTGTEMGKDLTTTAHPAVADLRDAWQALPPNRRAGPEVAVGPYREVARAAAALTQAAQASDKGYAPEQIQMLSAVANGAHRHAQRLAASLPSGHPAASPQAAQTPAPAAAAMSTPTAATPTASGPKVSV